MRVLQLIDSLRSGGAEKMSVSYANALAKRIEGSFLCCTRQEGLLKKQISPEVGYLFLEKKNIFDLKAFWKLRQYVKANKIELIQAHSSSWFLALLVKLSFPALKLVWYDHYGRELKERKSGALKLASRFFDGIISVNADLKKWAEENLNSRHVSFFRNFLSEFRSIPSSITVPLGGRGDDFKIVCLANLRPQKDHLTLLKAFELVEKKYPEISLHLIGRDEENDYSKGLKTLVKLKELEEKIFFYGELENIEEWLQEFELGVLSSSSEGLPVALLEYGRAGLPVVCTRVGECTEVVGENGIVVPPQDAEKLADAILLYFENKGLRDAHSKSFHNNVSLKYSEGVIVSEVIDFFRKIGTT